MQLNKQKLKTLLQGVSDPHDGRNLYAKCPKCGHDEFGISLRDGHRFGCFRKKACGWSGNIFTLLRYLDKFKEFNLDEKQVESIDHIEMKIDQYEKKNPLIEIDPPLGFRRKYQDDYLDSRGFTREQYEKYEIGRTVFKKDYVYIIIYQDGKRVGYVGRTTRSKKWMDEYRERTGKSYPKYDNSKSEFMQIIWGIDGCVDETHTVILVEGVFDKTNTEKELMLDDQLKIKCLCTFGGKLSNDQIRLLVNKGIKYVYLMYESDIVRTIKKVCPNLSIYFNTKVCRLDEDRDPGDMTGEELLDKLEASVSWMEYNLSII